MPESSPETITVATARPPSWGERAKGFIQEKVIDEHSPHAHERKILDRITRLAEGPEDATVTKLAKKLKPTIARHAYRLGVAQTVGEVTAVVAATAGASYILAKKALPSIWERRHKPTPPAPVVPELPSPPPIAVAHPPTDHQGQTGDHKPRQSDLHAPTVVSPEPPPFRGVSRLQPGNDVSGRIIGEGGDVTVYQSKDPNYVIVRSKSDYPIKERREGMRRVVMCIKDDDPQCAFAKLTPLTADYEDEIRMRKVAGYSFDFNDERIMAERARRSPVLLPLPWRFRAVAQIYTLLDWLIRFEKPTAMTDFKASAFWWNPFFDGAIELYLLDPPLGTTIATPQVAFNKTMYTFDDRQVRSMIDPLIVYDGAVDGVRELLALVGKENILRTGSFGKVALQLRQALAGAKFLGLSTARGAEDRLLQNLLRNRQEGKALN